MQTAPMATLPSSILEQNHKISILIWLLSPRQECSVVQWVQWSVLSLSTYLASSICSYLHYCAFQAALCLSVCIPHKDPGTIWSISLSVCLVSRTRQRDKQSAVSVITPLTDNKVQTNLTPQLICIRKLAPSRHPGLGHPATIRHLSQLALVYHLLPLDNSYYWYQNI